MWKNRSYDPELLDLGPSYYSEEEYEDAHRKLAQINKWLGGNAPIYKAIKSLKQPPESILDVGCGAGALAIFLAQVFPGTQIMGIDINPQAIALADKRVRTLLQSLPNLLFELKQQPELDEPSKSYDVVTTNLVCHHLNDEAVVDFIKRAVKVAKQKVIINDLQRSFLAYILFQAVSRIFFRNRIVYYDGSLSIRKAFTRKEWANYLTRAGLSRQCYHIRWKWAFRWLVEINVTKI